MRKVKEENGQGEVRKGGRRGKGSRRESLGRNGGDEADKGKGKLIRRKSGFAVDEHEEEGEEKDKGNEKKREKDKEGEVQSRKLQLPSLHFYYPLTYSHCPHFPIPYNQPPSILSLHYSLAHSFKRNVSSVKN